MWSANATNNFFILQNLTTCFGPYGPSAGDNYRNDIQYLFFRRFSIYFNESIIIHDYAAYLLLLNLYLYDIEEVLNMQLFT
jgi:hypothetical protein